MNEIAYLDYFKESYPSGRKPAKISQEKIRNLKANYDTNWKKLVTPVNTVVNNTVSDNVIPFQTASVTPTPVVTVQKPITSPVVGQPVVKNYKTVADDYKMSVFKRSFDVLDLAGARKIRVSQKTKNEVMGYSNDMGEGVLDNVIPFPKANATIQQEQPIINDGISNIREFPKTQIPSVNNLMASPSVDDYLQKDKPIQENGIIVQLAGDVETLKEETVKQSALLEQLEAKYNELKTKREQRIKDLEEEKLSYTATLEGLTERIKNLQEAIEKEEQSLSGGYQRAA